MKKLLSILFMMLVAIGIFGASTWIVKKRLWQPSPFRGITETELPNDVAISLRRGLCYGNCPDYVVRVSGDGTIVFEGRKFVRETGTMQGKISPEQVRELLKEFENADFFSLRDSYQYKTDGCPEEWTDHPTVHTSLTINATSKTITHYHGCKDGKYVYPKDLTALEYRIDEIIGTKQWIR